MRKLSQEKRSMVLSVLVEGRSVNSTARMCGVSKLTVLRVLADVSSLCRDSHDITVRGLRFWRVQVDEIWSFVGCKQKNKERCKSGHGNAEAYRRAHPWYHQKRTLRLRTCWPA